MWIWICRTHLNWLCWMSCNRKIVHLHVMWTGFEGALEFICILFSFRIPFITVQSHSVQHSISGPIQTMVEFLVASCYIQFKSNIWCLIQVFGGFQRWMVAYHIQFSNHRWHVIFIIIIISSATCWPPIEFVILKRFKA